MPYLKPLRKGADRSSTAQAMGSRELPLFLNIEKNSVSYASASILSPYFWLVLSNPRD